MITLKNKPVGPERRAFQVREFRVTKKDGGGQLIEGYASVFNTLSEPLYDWWAGSFREMVRPGAFNKTIQKDDIRALFNHDPNFVLGRNVAGTLRLSEDSTGLQIEITPPGTTFANDLLISMERGDINQMSFGFVTVTDAWRMKDGEEIRELLEVDLFDVSPVTYPAYTDTSVGLRSLVKEAGPEFENIAKLMIRSARGLELEDADHDLIKTSINTLSQMLPAEQEDPEEMPDPETPEPEQTRSIFVLRKRLALIEKQF